MPTIRGPIRISKRNLAESLEEAGIKVDLPFKAKNWKSEKMPVEVPGIEDEQEELKEAEYDLEDADSLNELSMDELREIGYDLDVRARSKDKLIELIKKKL